MEALKRDNPETRYQIVFNGTIGRERKIRRHSIGVMASLIEWRSAEITAEELTAIALAALADVAAKTGDWHLQSYTAYVSEYEIDGEIVTTAMRPMFDVSTKTLANGSLVKGKAQAVAA